MTTVPSYPIATRTDGDYDLGHNAAGAVKRFASFPREHSDYWTFGTFGAGEDLFSINGGITASQPADYGQTPLILNYHAGDYLTINGLDSPGNIGIAFVPLDSGGHSAPGYFFCHAVDGMKFQSPYVAATSTHLSLTFQIGEAGGDGTVCFSVLPTYQTQFSKPIADASFSKQTPSTGFSITVADGVGTLILDPSGTLATGTVTLPPTPVNGQILRLKSSQVVTSLTISPNSGQSVKGAPTSIALGGLIDCMYVSSNTTWYC